VTQKSFLQKAIKNILLTLIIVWSYSDSLTFWHWNRAILSKISCLRADNPRAKRTSLFWNFISSWTCETPVPEQFFPCHVRHLIGITNKAYLCGYLMENYRKRKSERAESKKGNESPCFLRSEFSESTGSDFYMILPYWSPVDIILHIFFLKSQDFSFRMGNPSVKVGDRPPGTGWSLRRKLGAAHSSEERWSR